jgi:hypothetical protein
MDETSLEEVMEALDGLYDDIDEIPRAAFENYRGYPPSILVEHDSRAAASCIYCHMVAETERRWVNRRGIIQRDIRGLRVWLIGDAAVLRWKKMDEDGRSRSYPTKQAKDYDFGEPLPGLPPPAVRLCAGYFLNPTQTDFIRSQVAKPDGRSVEWSAAIVPSADAAPGEKRWQDVSRQYRMG